MFEPFLLIAGIREALLMAAGSTAVPVITYGIISWDPLQLTFFVYPELILAVAALQVLVGWYTGYRLTELEISCGEIWVGDFKVQGNKSG